MTDQPADAVPAQADALASARARRGPLTWTVHVVAVAGLAVPAWAAVTSWGAVIHGYPLYAILLLATVAGSAVVGIRTLRSQHRRAGWRRVGRVVLIVGSIVWIALIAWLRPFTAVEPALAAMISDAKVTVSETPTQIVMTPAGDASTTGVFFQSGAKVEARAYAAVLRPLAEAGYTVVIPKQPLGIAFLAMGTFDSAKSHYPTVTSWVLAGHSLGGTVASMQADSGDTDPASPVVGLLLYASYPASDISTSLTATVLSVSGSNDGLATPADIAASKANLPTGAAFTVIDGAVHAFFGDYGPQPGDGTPAISHEDARQQISDASVGFVRSLDGHHT